MKTTIDSRSGVVSEIAGNGVFIEGLDALTVGELTVNDLRVGGLPADEYIVSSSFDDTWDDLQGTFDAASGVASLTIEVYKDAFSLPFFRHDQNDTVYMRYQMPHGWNKTAVRPHIHLMPCAQVGLNVTQSIDIGYQLGWLPARGFWPSTWTTGSITVPVSGSMYESHVKASFGEIAVSNPLASDVLLVRIVRSGSGAVDTFTTSKPGAGLAAANVAILYADVHYRSDRAGSIAEFG